MMKPQEPSDEDEQFIRSICLSEEGIRCRYPHLSRVGGWRWFESPNVIDPWARYSAVERNVISQRLRTRVNQ